MKPAIRFLVFIGFTVLGCKQDDVPKDTLECIKTLIEQIKNQSVWNPPANVYQYTYRGQTVYYIPPRCCDIPSVLLDGNCQAICSPDGGLTGRGDGKCQDFFTTRSDERLIWEDTRN